MAKRNARWYLARMEKLVGAHGPFCVGSKLSLADILLFYRFADVVPREESNKETPDHRLEPFGSAAHCKALLAHFPKLSAIIENVRGDAKLQAYLAARPKTA